MGQKSSQFASTFNDEQLNDGHLHFTNITFPQQTKHLIDSNYCLYGTCTVAEYNGPLVES